MLKYNLKQFLGITLGLLTGLSAFGQGVCTQFSYYYADINYPDSGTQTDIYSLSLSGSDAILTPIVEDLDLSVHLAFNEDSQLLYLVSTGNGDIRTLDPLTGEVSEAIPVDLSISGVTTTTFSAEGELLIGAGNGTIYIVDLDTNPYELSVFSENNDISGGDITFDAEGNLYLASKPQGKFYNVIPGFDNPLLGNVDGQVTGMATLEGGNGVIVSSRNNGQFLTYDLDGGVTASGAYDAKLVTGEPFSLENGDMTSGCNSRNTSIDGCDDLRTYYIHNAQGSGPVILYQVEFNELGGTILTELDDLGGGSHLGIGKDGFLYIVRNGSGMLKKFNPLTLGVENEVQINIDGVNVTNIPAVAVGDDGFVYVGSSADDTIYKVDPNTGAAEVFGEGNVRGGDLVFVGEALWLANRNQGRFYEINGDGQFDVDAEEINGVSVLPDGNLLIANGNLNGLFEVYEPITGNATGEVFETGLALFNGDLASRCFDGQPIFQSCDDFRTYFIHTPVDGVDAGLYGVNITDLGEISFDFIREVGDSHLGVGPDGLLYVVGGGQLSIIDPLTNTSAQLPITDQSGAGLGGIPAVVVGDDGTLYVGSSPRNEIYTVNTSTGVATFFADAQVSGGDLVFAGGELWVANRSTAIFTSVTSGTTFSIDAADILGVSALPDGNLLVANGDFGSTFDVYEPITGNFTGTSYETGFELYWGDLASRCFDDNNVVDGCDNFQLFLAANGNQGGDIYSISIDEGMLTLDLLIADLGRPHIAYDESNGLIYVVEGPTGEVAIYDPVADILTAYSNIAIDGTNIGDTYSAVVTNDGRLLVGSNATNMVYEVDPLTGMASNPIDVPVNGGDIIQTNDGNIWVLTRNENRFYNITDGVSQFDVELNEMYGAAVMDNGMILVGDAGTQLRVVDPETASTTETIYELGINVAAGDLAGGCGDNYVPLENPQPSPNLTVNTQQTILIAFPNPTENFSNIEITSYSTERAVVEIFDMNGKSVATLLNQDVQAGNTYRTTFDATTLPNGIYVVKYVTPSESIIEKIMIAR